MASQRFPQPWRHPAGLCQRLHGLVIIQTRPVSLFARPLSVCRSPPVTISAAPLQPQAQTLNKYLMTGQKEERKASGCLSPREKGAYQELWSQTLFQRH